MRRASSRVMRPPSRRVSCRQPCRRRAPSRATRRRCIPGVRVGISTRTLSVGKMTTNLRADGRRAKGNHVRLWRTTVRLGARAGRGKLPTRREKLLPIELTSSELVPYLHPVRELRDDKRELLYSFESGKLKMRWLKRQVSNVIPEDKCGMLTRRWATSSSAVCKDAMRDGTKRKHARCRGRPPDRRWPKET
jgi:hypothetical protein